MTNRFVAASVFVLLALVACGGGTSGTTGGGTGTTTGGSSSGGTYTCQYQEPGASALCDTCTSATTACDSYSGSSLSSQMSDISETCALNTSPTHPTTCPTANRIGCCAYPYLEGTAINLNVVSCFYGTADAQTNKLPTQCNPGIQGGVWTAN